MKRHISVAFACLLLVSEAYEYEQMVRKNLKKSKHKKDPYAVDKMRGLKTKQEQLSIKKPTTLQREIQMDLENQKFDEANVRKVPVKKNDKRSSDRSDKRNQ